MSIENNYLPDKSCLENAEYLFNHYSSVKDIKDIVLQLMADNQCFRQDKCINLVAAEGPMSPVAKKMLSDDCATRAAGGQIGKEKRAFVATDNIDQWESICYQAIKKLFQCHYCDLRLLSGVQASQIVYASLTKKGDSIITVLPEQGGDSCNSQAGFPGVLGLHIIPMPFCDDGIKIDVVQLKHLLIHYKPSLIVIGFSVSLIHQPIKAIKKLAAQMGVKIYYDAAHELGLIAGGVYPNPLSLGVDVMTGSTAKTFSGPQGGLLLWNDSTLNQLFPYMVSPVFVGSHQPSRVAALTMTALELLAFGNNYMQKIVANGSALANALDEWGFNLFIKTPPFTQTHQVLLVFDNDTDSLRAIKRLTACHIITNMVTLPHTKNSHQTKALRLGTTEVTRKGMKEAQMKQIAKLIFQAINENKKIADTQKKVRSLVQPFKKMQFCFEEEKHVFSQCL